MMYLNNQQGHLLLLTMVVLVFVSLFAATGLYISYNTKTDSLLNSDRLQAYYIADAGIELALAKLQQDADWRNLDPGFNNEFADGTIESLQVKTLTKTEDYDKVEIISRGLYQQAQKTLIVTAQIERQEDGQIKIKIISWKELYPIFV